MRAEVRGLKVLPPETCLRLLDAHPVHLGRLAANDLDGQPFILPVNYRVDGTSIVIRTQPQSFIAQRALRRRVAFEADDVDAVWQDGWSVLVRGTAERVTDVVELDRLRQLPLHPWAPGDRSLYIRIAPTLITGRQIV